MSDPGGTVQVMDAPTDRQLLELAGRDYRLGGSVERAAAEELGIGSTAFWSAIVRILDAPAPDVALEFGPLLNRLRRMRAARQVQRRAG